MFWIAARTRSSLRLRYALAAGLAAIADYTLFGQAPGSILGVVLAGFLVIPALVRPDILRNRRGLAALGLAFGFALVLFDRPGFVALVLLGLFGSIASLSSRVPAREGAWGWGQRLVYQTLACGLAPLIDCLKIKRAKRPSRGLPLVQHLFRLGLPIGGGALFLWLFTLANPVLSRAMAALPGLRLPNDAPARAVVFILLALFALSLLRPRLRQPVLALPTRRLGRSTPGLSTSIVWSLAVFNAVFALQNGLDIAFLWSGAPLPQGVTLADYAHRGAYPLIVTALLAGLFVLIALQPGSDTSKRPLARRLVVLWIGQNMLLVASSLLRTADYVDAFGLTRFRLAAILWMVLVAVGLAFICWRMLQNKSADWLINANAAAVLFAFSLCSLADLGAVAAAWNVRHAREVAGRGVELDLDYMHGLGASALVALVEADRSKGGAGFKARCAEVREAIRADTRRRQKNWRTWTWRNQRRLARVEAIEHQHPLTPSHGFAALNLSRGSPAYKSSTLTLRGAD